MQRFMTVGLLATAMLAAGCGQRAADPHTLVVDPVPVAKSLGRDEAIKRQLDSAIEQLNAQLQQHTSELSAQVEQEKAKLGKNPSDESTARYQELVAAAAQNVQQTQQLARQKASDYRATLLAEFNTELRAAAAEIARARGAEQVLIVDDSVLWFDPASDITADMIAKLRAKADSAPAPAAEQPAERNSEIEQLEKLVDSIERKEQTAADTPAAE